MLDIRFIKENIDLVDMAAKKKHIDFDVSKLIEVDDERRKIVKEIDEMRTQQNILTEKIPSITDELERNFVVEKSRGLKTKLQSLEENSKKIMKATLCLQNWMKQHLSKLLLQVLESILGEIIMKII